MTDTGTGAVAQLEQRGSSRWSELEASLFQRTIASVVSGITMALAQREHPDALPDLPAELTTLPSREKAPTS